MASSSFRECHGKYTISRRIGKSFFTPDRADRASLRDGPGGKQTDPARTGGPVRCLRGIDPVIDFSGTLW